MSEIVHTAVNGFGRIGLVYARQVIESQQMSLDAIGVRSLDPHSIAQRLMFDTVHREFVGHTVQDDGEQIVVDDNPVALVNTAYFLPNRWSDVHSGLVVVEATGSRDASKQVASHLTTGAEAVVITAPTNDPDILTVVRGVNDTDSLLDEAAETGAVAVSSCSTNCIAPILKLFSDHHKIVSASAQVVHARTNSQPHLDGSGIDVSDRRSADNIVVSSTGSAVEVNRLFPDLSFHANSIRVPVADGSLAIIGMELKGQVGVDEVYALITELQKNDVIGSTEDDVFSAAVIGSTYSSVIDLNQIRTEPRGARTYVELQAWFDNEWGYTSRVREVAFEMGRRILAR